MKKLTAILLSVLLLNGCSTSYQKKGFGGGGYDDMRLSNDSYMVEYKSNGFTEPSTNFKHVLRRAAELTKQNGYKYFKVIKDTDTTTRFTTPVESRTTARAQKDYYGNGKNRGFEDAYGTSTTVVSGGDTYVLPGISIVITMLKSKTNDAYDADVVLSNFKKS